jgi:hypothetical protein
MRVLLEVFVGGINEIYDFFYILVNTSSFHFEESDAQAGARACGGGGLRRRRRRRCRKPHDC